MIASKDKISLRQALILFIMATLSPAIRLFPQYAAKSAGKAGWLSPVAAIIPVIFLILMLSSFFKKKNGANLSDIFFEAIGKIAGKIVICLYLIWILLLLALYVRYYSERILSSTMPNVSINFLVIVMLCLVYAAAKYGLVTIARANEIFFSIFIIIFLLSFIFSTPQIKYKNLMNLSYLDIFPVIKSSVNIFGIWGYVLFIFFFGDRINDKEHIKKFGFRCLGVVFILSIVILIMVIGSLGSRLAVHVSLPFFMVVKNISILETIDHIESTILSLWVISDFIIITVFANIALALAKSIFNLSDAKSLISPMVLIAGIGSLYLAQNRFELETFSTSVALPVNVAFEYIIPIIVFGIGKIRKKI